MASKTTAPLLFLTLVFFSATSTPCSPKTKPTPKPTPAASPPKLPRKVPPVNPFCPRDTLKIGYCVSLIGGAVSALVGENLGSNCCSLLDGLSAIEVAACLCTTIKENVLGISVEWDIALSVFVSSCNKKIPDGFKCV